MCALVGRTEKRCVLYKEEEYIDHLLFICEYSQEIWFDAM